MKKLLLTSIYMAVITVSNMAYGLGNDIQRSEASVDAFKALQVTRSMVYADLEKNIQATLCSVPTQRIKGFGIDDTDSYAQEQKTRIGQLGVEG